MLFIVRDIGTGQTAAEKTLQTTTVHPTFFNVSSVAFRGIS